MSFNDVLPAARAELTPDQRLIMENRIQHARSVAAREDPPTGVGPATRPARIPLSFSQERLWFLDQLDPDRATYTLFQAVRLTGPLDLDALDGGLQEIVRRHEILRTNFRALDGTPEQVVAPRRSVPLPLEDLSAQPGASRDAELDRRLRNEVQRPFDLASGPLLRALLVRLAPEEHVLLVTMHHIVSDGWSLAVFFRELSLCYSALRAGRTPELEDLPMQFTDFALWERGAAGGSRQAPCIAYWQRHLSGSVPMVDLPARRRSPHDAPCTGDSVALVLPPALAKSARQLGQACGATLFMTLLAAFKALLHRHTGQEDIVVGSVVDGRRQSGLELMIGFFVNTVVFRGNLSGNPTFREWLAREREEVLNGLANQDLPFARLVEMLRPDRHLTRNPLFQVMFVLQDGAREVVQPDGLALEPLEVATATAKFDLTLVVTETQQGLRALLEYDASRHEADTMRCLLNHYRTLLEAVVADPDRRIAEYPLLDDTERGLVLSKWAGATEPFPEESIGRLFEEQAALRPDAVAIEQEGRRVSYAELGAASNRLAARLREAGVGSETPVGIAVGHSVEFVTALLGVLKAGGAYTVLDPSATEGRFLPVLEDLRPPLVLASAPSIAHLSALTRRTRSSSWPGPQFLAVEDSPNARSAPDGSASTDGASSQSLACIAYGPEAWRSPRGVCIEHRSLVSQARSCLPVRILPEDVFLLSSSSAFGTSTPEIWGALLNGARLVIAPPEPLSSVMLARLLVEQNVTVLWLPAGLFARMIDEQPESLRGLRLLIACGETVSTRHVRRAAEVLPGTAVMSVYGKAETSDIACGHLVSSSQDEEGRGQVGRPLPNTRAYILDERLQPAPIGVAGELFVGGAGLARGYWLRAEMTRERFPEATFPPESASRLFRTGDRARWRPDGEIEFLGRTNRETTIRGYRVDPGVIEDFLLDHPSVREAAVIAAGEEPAGRRLLAYLVVRPTAPAGDALREYLSARLPGYMVPVAFVFLEELPRLPEGGVNYAALPTAGEGRALDSGKGVAPRDAVERRLCRLWEQVLGLGQVGVHDQFFDLGGHSLLAVRLLALVEKSFGLRLPVATVFHHRTVAQMARLLRSRAEAERESSVVEIQPKGDRPPLFLVHGVGGGMFWGYANLSRHLGEDQPVLAFKSRGLDGRPEAGSIREMAARYVEDLRAHQPTGPYRLGGYCFGGVVAYEMARQLDALGERTELLALIDCAPPNTGYSLTRRSWSPLWMSRFLVNLSFWAYSFFRLWSPAERRDFVRWKLRVTGKRLARAFHREIQGESIEVEEMVDLAPYSGHQRELWESHVRLLLSYRPEPYRGAVTLFRTRGHPMFCSFDPQYGWGPLAAGGVSVKVIAGCHGNMLDEPHVHSVAAELQQCLQDSNAPTRMEAQETCTTVL